MNHDDRTKRFYALVWPHAPAAMRTARLLLANADDADDLAQEALAKAFRGIDGLGDGSDARAWLFTILRNARTDFLRASASRRGDVSLDANVQEPIGLERPSPAEESAWQSPKRLLESFSDGQVIGALQALPEEIRWTLLLVDVEGLSHADAAPILGVPIGTVKSRVSRGRSMLRSALLPLASGMRLTD